MKVAVTGGNGFLGRYVCEELKLKGITPIIITRKKETRDNITYISDYSVESLLPCFESVDAIIHLAAMRGSTRDVNNFLDNLKLTQNIYETCLKIGITNIVYASSISVYSDENLLPWKESQRTKPFNVYGVIKQACESLGEYYNSNFNFNIKNLRLAHLFGYNEDNDYMINKFIKQSFAREILSVNACLNGKREFLYAKDAAKAIVKSIGLKEMRGIFNIGSNEALTNLEIAQYINEVFNNPTRMKVEYGGNLHSSYMSSELSKNILNYSPQYNFKDAMREIYNQLKTDNQ